MALLPYALRPSGVLRRFVIRRGVVGGSRLLQPVAMLMVGQGEYLRARALRQGLILGNNAWRLIGVALVMQEMHRRVVRRPVEVIAIERLRPGHRLRVNVTEPVLLPRKQRRAALRLLEAEALASVRAFSSRS